ncbi:FAD-dependent oxidoreductase [Mesorhizobium sp.]|uniref:oxidoreductase n=1 Tax=Mesorhizobium sp. TaxID=1871066 RepID=UPI0025D95ACE|nr:FAD-dependent oxidoreductase [Mesorhizobium sp.]
MDDRFELLFQPVKIGPVTAPNRFYQVPHCTGMGYALPRTLATMRGVKAEGGWGVVNTEYCSIHATSDDMPYAFASLWDDVDVANMAYMTELVHAHGSLAGVELWHGGARTANLHSRMPPVSFDSMPVAEAPWQSRRLDLQDIRDVRRWHRAAALRAKKAGFDIVYAYAAHRYLIGQSLDPDVNNQDDEYGIASQRSKLLVEILQDMKEAIGEKCAVALRIDVGAEASRRQRNELLASISHLVDLFDITVPDYQREMGVSRFVKEGSLEGDVAHIRALTGKPVVSVGRFTSPETMLSQVKRGVLDLVGAARPSIADPFLPAKIREGRIEDIRECIGCNICYAHNSLNVPIRCTQNPTMGEEWRRGWHPERFADSDDAGPVLIVGAGPAGLEAALTLGRRGVEVYLAEATRHLGGRINMESRLPGLAEWARVRDWRVGQLAKLSNVQVFRESLMDRASVAELGVEHVMIATGSRWRTDGKGRTFPGGVPSYANPITMSVEAAAELGVGALKIVIFDDDHYYIGSALAERMARSGHKVVLVTAQGRVAQWSTYTTEQSLVHKQLLSLGVEILTNSFVTGVGVREVEVDSVFSSARRALACDLFVPVTSREPNDRLWHDLSDAGLQSLCRVGDCSAPGIIAQAVYDGHRHGRQFGRPGDTGPARERVAL